MIWRNLFEVAAIIAIWGLVMGLRGLPVPASALILIILLISFAKTSFFGLENLRQLFEATRRNLPYHRFMLLMLVNMGQIILSFALDFHCLHCVNTASFGELFLPPESPQTVFEFVYFSTLNFTFFGYGDMTPQTVPAKLLTMTEIVLAFTTVIFLLSDFISLKESLRPPGGPPSTPQT